MKPWVKLYTEINRDVDMGTLTWAQRGIWSALLALAGDIDARDAEEHETGQLDTEARVAWMIRCEPSEMREAVSTFMHRGMVEERDGMLYLPNYGKRQAKPPSQERPAARDRQREHRASQPCHKPVTSAAEAVTTQNRLDSDTDRDEKREDTDRDEIESVRAAGAALDSAFSEASDSISIDGSGSEPPMDTESPELGDCIRKWSWALKDGAAVESNLTQIFAIWGGYPQIRAPDMIRLVNDMGTMVQRMQSVQRPMAYLFKSIRGELERKLGPPPRVGKALRGPAPVAQQVMT
jgi:hypothetical protein